MEAWRLKMEHWRLCRLWWSQIRITLMRSRIRVRIHIEMESWIRIRINVKSCFRICIEVMQICNPDFERDKFGSPLRKK
jgi:hypothetical protein